jgi:elongation factor G
MAFKDGVRKGRPQLLEPIMRVEVTGPEEYLGTILGDLNSRRGRVEGMEARGNAQVIRALVPLASMFAYANDLRSATQGRASYSMEFDRYEPLPENLAQEIIAKQRG